MTDRPKIPAPQRIARFYDRIALLYDWATLVEGRGQTAALELLAPRPGERILDAGTGAGREQARIARALEGNFPPVGVDISYRMLRSARKRARALWVQADIRHLPFATGVFDAVYCAYVLDVLSPADLRLALREFHRLLREGGRAVLLTLTEGVSPLGRAFVWAWKTAYRLAPLACGGCRPLQLNEMATESNFAVREAQVIEEFGIPSALLLLEKRP